MNILARWSGLICFASLVGSALHAGGIMDFLSPRNSEVLTITDVTDEGRLWPSPEPGKPVFYEAMSFGSRNFQSLAGDVKPNSHAMVELITKTLAEQGFQRADKKGVAKIFLSIAWGYSRANLGSLGFLGGEKLNLMGELGNDSPRGLKFDNPQWMRSTSADKMMRLAESNLYFASIQAFDLEKLDAGKPVLLWHTRIICEARGIYMADAIPSLIIAGAPSIGRETTKPVWRDAVDSNKTRVGFGPLKTIELIDIPAEHQTSGDKPDR